MVKITIENIFLSSSAGRGAEAKNEDITMDTYIMGIMMVNHMIVMEMIMRLIIVRIIVALQHNHHAIDPFRMEIRRLQEPITINWTNVIH